MPEWIAKYWFEELMGLLVAGLGVIVKLLSGRVKKQKEESDAVKAAVRSLLRRNLIRDCEEAVKDGYCSVTRRDVILDMYESYHTLGGNGSVTDLKEQVRKLPTMKAGGDAA